MQQTPGGLHPKGHSTSLPFPWAHPPFCAVTQVEEQAQLRQSSACPAQPAGCSPHPTLGSGLGPSHPLHTEWFLITKASRILISQSYTSKADTDTLSRLPLAAQRKGKRVQNRLERRGRCSSGPALLPPLKPVCGRVGHLQERILSCYGNSPQEGQPEGREKGRAGKVDQHLHLLALPPVI